MPYSWKIVFRISLLRKQALTLIYATAFANDKTRAEFYYHKNLLSTPLI